MVRLVITDFATKEDNEAFYLTDEFDVLQYMFTYDSFKKHSVYLSKYEASEDIYSLNLLSKKHLDANQFFVYIEDDSFIILFNHKTVYSAKINANFITDDIIKSILIAKHITMLSSGGEIDKYFYLVNSKYKYAVENILKHNTKNEYNKITAQKLGELEDLIKPLNPLDTYKTHITKSVYLVVFLVSILWVMFFGLKIVEKQFIDKESLSKLKREVGIEDRLLKRQNILLRTANRNHKKIIECITKDEVSK